MLGPLRERVLRPFRNAWKGDIRAGISPVKGDLARVTRELETLRSTVDREVAQLRASLTQGLERATRAERDAAQLRLAIRLNEAHADVLHHLEQTLNPAIVLPHVQQAIRSAPLELDPFPHMVVENLLPEETYRVLLKAIPPSQFFGDRDPIKQNLRIPLDFGPVLTLRVWGFMDEVIARQAIRPAVLERFEQPLLEHLERTFGAAHARQAADLPQSVSGGRVMLRRPGYKLPPHRDPKRTLVTCLMYLAGKRDMSSYGTEIYRVADDAEAPYTQTYYPEQRGHRCEFVKMVPYRANSMLIFLNSGGAHGAQIPADAPVGTERFSYQFYIGPDPENLDSLISALPPERKALWRSKSDQVDDPMSGDETRPPGESR